MTPKKKNKANLERLRFILFETGILASLGFILLAFSWGTEAKENAELRLTASFLPEKDIIISTPRREDPVKLKETKIIEILNFVDNDDPQIDEVDFSSEIDGHESFRMPEPGVLPDEVMDPVDFVAVEEKPLFNGGDPMIEFRKYIAMNVKYPQEAIDNDVTGRVILSFVVNSEGRVADVQVIGPVHPVLDQAAKKVVESSPLWTPGKQRTKPVPVRFYFPVVFRLNY